jgi:hypothetical protein
MSGRVHQPRRMKPNHSAEEDAPQDVLPSAASRLLFRFKDGSVDDETMVFSQRGTFQLITDHHVQKGPSFPQPMDLSIDVRRGQVMVRSRGKDGKEEVKSEHMDLPSDLVNGLILSIAKNIRPDRGHLTKRSCWPVHGSPSGQRPSLAYINSYRNADFSGSSYEGDFAASENVTMRLRTIRFLVQCSRCGHRSLGVIGEKRRHLERNKTIIACRTLVN